MPDTLVRPVAVGAALLLQQRGGPYISTQQILRGRFVQLRFCQQLLQLRVLCLELFQPPGFRDGHSCVFRLPIVERRLREPILPAEVFGRGASLRLPQHRDDLLFCLALRFLRSHVGKLYSHSVLTAGVTSVQPRTQTSDRTKSGVTSRAVC
jgi:hypothetical protein